MTLANVRDVFLSVLEESRNPNLLYSSSGYVGLVVLVTLGGRLPFRQGLASLTTREAALVMAVMGRDDITLIRPDSKEIAECNILVKHSSFGKVSLYLRDEEASLEDEVLVGGMKVDDSLLDMVEDEFLVEELLERQERRNFDAIVLEWEIQGCIVDKVNQVIDWVERIESLYIFIGRRVFSRSDVGDSTLARQKGVLQSLIGHPVKEWAPEIRFFVLAMHLFFLAGGVFRVEEFNGKQLTAIQFHQWLLQKFCSYCVALGEELPSDLPTMSLSDLAVKVGQLASRVDRSDWIRFRRVNGITFVKEERLIPPDKVAHTMIELPPLVADVAARTGLEVDLVGDPLRDIGEMARAALRHSLRSGSSEYVHLIIECLVLSAILEAGADIGMSSSLRTPSRLKGMPEHRIAGALSLSKSDFYCCVLPHPSVVGSQPDQDLNRVLYSVAQRMEFNRWHFVPGNFSREEIPQDRHYYPPPRLPDLAQWSDLRHPGHIKALVRYSVRAPAPSLWSEPFVAYDHPYRGWYDIRLFRAKGPPFRKEELNIAIRYTSLMDAFWKAMQQFVEEQMILAPIVTAYTREWYGGSQWRSVVEECVATNPLVGMIRS